MSHYRPLVRRAILSVKCATGPTFRPEPKMSVRDAGPHNSGSGRFCRSSIAVASLALAMTFGSVAPTSGFGAQVHPKYPVRPLHVETAGSNVGVVGTRQKVELEAVLYPQGNYSHFWFQWGTSRAYGHTTRIYLDEGYDVFGPEEVFAIIEHVRPSTTYHYRVVGRNRLGKVYGTDRLFRTQHG